MFYNIFILYNICEKDLQAASPSFLKVPTVAFTFEESVKTIIDGHLNKDFQQQKLSSRRQLPRILGIPQNSDVRIGEL